MITTTIKIFKKYYVSAIVIRCNFYKQKYLKI